MSRYGLVAELGRFMLLPAHRHGALTTAMFFFAGYAAAKHRIMSGYMVMERRLCDMLNELGVHPVCISPEIDLRVKRRVYVMTSADILKGIIAQKGDGKRYVDAVFWGFKYCGSL